MRITRTYYDLSGTLDGDLTQLSPEAKAKFLDTRLAHTVEYEVSDCGAATPITFDGVPLVSVGERGMLLKALQQAVDCQRDDESPVPFWLPEAKAAIASVQK